LKESRVVDAVVVVVAGVDVQGRLGHRAATHVQNVGQALAGGRVERLVHVSDALAGREIGRAQTGHRKSRSDRRSSVLSFRFDEDQRTAGDVDVTICRFFGPILAHLRRWGDGIRARRVSRFALTHDDGGIAVHRLPYAGKPECPLCCHDR
jgi:hypothetical protein